jgi:hypothetical protein
MLPPKPGERYERPSKERLRLRREGRELLKMPENVELGPCATHATINCLQCYDIDPEDLDEDGNLIVVDGQEITDATR